MVGMMRTLACLMMLWWLGIQVAMAQLAIEITGSSGRQIAVALPYLVNEEALPQSLTEIVRSDLERSALFRVVDVGWMRAPEDLIPDYAALTQRGAEAVLAGSVYATAPGVWEARLRLFDTVRRSELTNRVVQFNAGQLRAAAHRIADLIYEALTGVPGYFTTRLAYVVKSGNRYELKIGDYDGSHAATALVSPEPIISPAWSPDGHQLAYVSFENKKPVVYIHEVATGRRRVAANFRGSNSAPAWSPDGRKLAVTLTQDGISQIYVLDLTLNRAFRVSRSGSIDTEPVFSPDGQWLYFTSDRGGSPQIYRMPATGGDAQRITFEGSYNVSPDVSPDGRALTYITRIDGRFRVVYHDLTAGYRQILTDSERDESPAFAPTGHMIVYATEVGGRGVLAAVSTDGRVRLRLSASGADVREPAWGRLPR
ncbi:Tol-Pal system beta propeller repeat protein TolB [Hydrogenophilus thermoluteolus]|uniref:Tol-Pal system protein TolB n=2 Tax=Hydrogenophilus thermoluteolus TaxID=297 RepID=A0A2Z6E0M8_HYDTE|nr:Tol-Pal system beta propeller repeat protein TolB [Hydrogenophilus thermoluteolus]